MKVDIELDEDIERKLVWSACKNELSLGISSSLRNLKPYVCAYMFNYHPTGDVPDIEGAPKKKHLYVLLREYIVDHILFCFKRSNDKDERAELRNEMVLLIRELDAALKIARFHLRNGLIDE